MLKGTLTPSERRAQGSTFPWWTPALLATLLLLAAALAGCGGDSNDTAEDDRPPNTDMGSLAEPEPQPTRPAFMGGVASRPTAVPEPGSIAEPEAQPTRQQVLGGVASGPTTVPVATVDWSEVMLSSSGSDEDGREVNAGFASVSAGSTHTCGVRIDHSVARMTGTRPRRPPVGSFPLVPGQVTPAGWRPS